MAWQERAAKRTKEEENKRKNLKQKNIFFGLFKYGLHLHKGPPVLGGAWALLPNVLTNHTRGLSAKENLKHKKNIKSVKIQCRVQAKGFSASKMKCSSQFSALNQMVFSWETLRNVYRKRLGKFFSFRNVGSSSVWERDRFCLFYNL